MVKSVITGVFLMTNFTLTWAGTARSALGLHQLRSQVNLCCNVPFVWQCRYKCWFSFSPRVIGNVDTILKDDACL